MLCYPPPLPLSGSNNLYRVFVSLNGQNYNSDGLNVTFVSYKTTACPYGQVGATAQLAPFMFMCRW